MTDETRQSPAETVSHADPCEAIATAGEFKCDRCQALWYGELAKTDWRPGACKQLTEYHRPEPVQQPLTKEQAEDLTRRAT